MMQSCSAVRVAPLGCRRAGAACQVPKRWLCAETRSKPLTSTLQSKPLHNRSSPSCSRFVKSFNQNSPPSRRLYSSDAPSIAQASYIDDGAFEPLPERFRSAMRQLTHPVVVLTASDGAQHLRAITMSSFTSLALSPTPLVTFNVAVPSRSFDALSHSGEFNIHILASDKHGASLADQFTKGNADGVFDDVDYVNAASGPVLEGEGVLYVLRCRLAVDDAPTKGLIRVRDHVIVVAEVLEMIPGLGGQEFGLAYTDRAYRRVGDTIKKHEY